MKNYEKYIDEALINEHQLYIKNYYIYNLFGIIINILLLLFQMLFILKTIFYFFPLIIIIFNIIIINEKKYLSRKIYIIEKNLSNMSIRALRKTYIEWRYEREYPYSIFIWIKYLSSYIWIILSIFICIINIYKLI